MNNDGIRQVYKKGNTLNTAKLGIEPQTNWIPDSPQLITKLATGQDLERVPCTASFPNCSISFHILPVPSRGCIPKRLPNKNLNFFLIPTHSCTQIVTNSH